MGSPNFRAPPGNAVLDPCCCLEAPGLFAGALWPSLRGDASRALRKEALSKTRLCSYLKAHTMPFVGYRRNR